MRTYRIKRLGPLAINLVAEPNFGLDPKFAYEDKIKKLEEKLEVTQDKIKKIQEISNG